MLNSRIWFKGLLCCFGPIIETIDRFGLRRRYLNRHKREVDCYYRKIAKIDAKSDIVAKYRAPS